MSGVEEAIVLATLEEGGRKPLQDFSLSHVAQTCGFSEFVIFDHFKSKENLLASSDHFVFEQLQKQIVSLKKTSSDFFAFFNGLIDFQLAHPAWNGFLLNYGYLPKDRSFKTIDIVFPRDGVFSILKDLMENEDLNLGEDEIFILYTFFLQELLSFAQLILNLDIPDTPENRAREAQLITWGLAS
jgi:AcrR family transcriptional regulator